MVNTINPADALPGEVYEGTVDGERLVLFRRPGSMLYPWESLKDLHDHVDVSELVRLVPAAGGEWTRDDLPSAQSLREYEVPATLPDRSVVRGWNVLVPPDRALDEIVDHLNAHHPKPDDPCESCGADEALKMVGDIGRGMMRAQNQRAEFRRERDEARRERDEWKARAEQYEATLRASDTALRSCERELDEARARIENQQRLMVAHGVPRDTVIVGGPGAAPPVTRDDIGNALMRVGVSNGVETHAEVSVGTDAVWSLVSGADPAVFAVRESQVAAVEVHLDGHGRWIAEGSSYSNVTPESLRRDIPAHLSIMARREAVARAIEAEQATDPVQEKARELAAIGAPGTDWEDLHHAAIGAYTALAEAGVGREVNDA